MTTNNDFAARLSITANALNCSTKKDLCALFQAANPRTQCHLDRLHKWMQGRALPRSALVYEDWAKVLGTKRTGQWLATCAIESFLAEVSALTGIAVADLRESRTLRLRRPAPSVRPGIAGGDTSLVGAFACYSPSWSPHYRGKLVRGSLRIEPRRGTALQATYTQRLMGRLAPMSGEILITGRTLHLTARDAGSQLPVFFSAILPGAPISVLCGVVSGAAFVAADGLPSVSRMVAIRVAERIPLEESNRYLDADPAIICADLEALGIQPLGQRLATLVAEFLGEGLDQVTPEHRTHFAAVLDPAHLGLSTPLPVHARL